MSTNGVKLENSAHKAPAQERLRHFKQRLRPMSHLKFQADDSGDKVEFDGDKLLGLITLAEASGTVDSALGWGLLSKVATALSSDKETDPSSSLNLAMTALHEMAPRDYLEGQLAAQMVCTHNAAMRFLATVSKSESSEQIGRNIEWATKLMRTFTSQIEALNRYRARGQQKVTVEHVTVHSGGQALVGNFEAGQS